MVPSISAQSLTSRALSHCLLKSHDLDSTMVIFNQESPLPMKCLFPLNSASLFLVANSTSLLKWLPKDELIS